MNRRDFIKSTGALSITGLLMTVPVVNVFSHNTAQSENHFLPSQQRIGFDHCTGHFGSDKTVGLLCSPEEVQFKKNLISKQFKSAVLFTNGRPIPKQINVPDNVQINVDKVIQINEVPEFLRVSTTSTEYEIETLLMDSHNIDLMYIN